MTSDAVTGDAVKEAARAPWWHDAALLLPVALLARWRTFGNPVIGFDEQFYLLVGDRMLHGALPYVDIFDRKPLGLFLIYAAARWLGALFGDGGFLAYKLVALGFVVGTATLLTRGARRLAPPPAALLAGALYLLWLDLMEGEGGQGEVLLGLPMAGAALLVWRAAWVETPRPKRLVSAGCAAMLLAGLALQIKYTAAVEAVSFGLMLLVAGWRAGMRPGALLAAGTGWVACALAPTLLALGWYAHLGQLHAFLFANFLSMFGRHAETWANEGQGALVTLGILLPLLALAAWGLMRGERLRLAAPLAFPLLWLAAALFGYFAFHLTVSPHYAMPLVMPLSLLAAAAMARGQLAREQGAWRAGIGVALLGLVAGQVVLAVNGWAKGGADAAEAVARAAMPPPGQCIWVYDGYPALYMLTHSCLPTRWAFPGHLNYAIEDNTAALGVDTVAEVRRILATRPPVIVDDWPRDAAGNHRTRALVRAALAEDYRLVARVRTGKARYRLVYRRR